MTDHAILSGSASYRWMNCPGSIRMIGNVSGGDGGGTSSYAREGIFAHAVGAHILTTDEIPEAGSQFTYLDHDEKIVGEITEDMLNVVMIYVNHVRRHGQKGVIKVEHHVNLSALVRDQMFGTCDALIIKADELVVDDFKFGYYPVHLVDTDLLLSGGELSHVNSQLLYYAAGAAHEYEWRHRQIVVEIIQPRCMEVPDIQSIKINRDQLRSWAENDLWKAAHLATLEDAPLVPGDWCRFCPAMHDCPAIRSTIQDLAVVDFAGLEVKQPETPETVEQIVKILRWAPIMDSWLRAVEIYALELAKRGVNIPGSKLVEKGTKRRWPEGLTNEEIYKKLKAAGGTGAIKHFLVTKFVTPAKAEKIAGKNAVAAVAIKPRGELTLVPESSRKHTATDIESDFDEFAED